MSSDVARLRAQLELEAQSLMNLSRFRACASHEAITHAYERFAQVQEELAAELGSEHAGIIAVGLLGMPILGEGEQHA